MRLSLIEKNELRKRKEWIYRLLEYTEISKEDLQSLIESEKYKDEIRYFASRVHEVWDFWEVPEE